MQLDRAKEIIEALTDSPYQRADTVRAITTRPRQSRRLPILSPNDAPRLQLVAGDMATLGIVLRGGPKSPKLNGYGFW